MNKKIIAIIVIVLIIIGGGIGVYALAQNNNLVTKKPAAVVAINRTTWENNVLTIKASEAKTALKMLQQNATIATTGTGENAYVTSVNGVSADAAKNEFWEFDVNGASASVGVGSYITKIGDTITLKISTF